jgi:hypothetical protein
MMELNLFKSICHIPPSQLTAMVHQPVVQNLHYTLIWRVVLALLQDLTGYTDCDSELVPMRGDVIPKLNQQVIQIRMFVQ